MSLHSSFLKQAVPYTWWLQRPITICAQSSVNNETLKAVFVFQPCSYKICCVSNIGNSGNISTSPFKETAVVW